jgi:hypothetical protein
VAIVPVAAVLVAATAQHEHRHVVLAAVPAVCDGQDDERADEPRVPSIGR